MMWNDNFLTAFQAEYEGSIPFTRSSLFKDLARVSDFILTNGLPYTF